MKLTESQIIELLNEEFPIFQNADTKVVKQFNSFGEKVANAFLLTSNSPGFERFVAKGYGLKPSGLQTEHLALQFLEEKNFHSPKLLIPDHKPHNLLLMEYIDGENAEEVLKKGDKSAELFYQIGEVVGKLHTFPYDSIGPLSEKSTKSWEKFQSQKFLEKKEELYSLLDPELYKEMSRLVDSSIPLLKEDQNPTVFIHRDIYLSNFVLSTNNNLYLLDFAMTSGGKALYELAKFYIIDLYDKPQFLGEFLKGYKVSQKFPDNFKELMKMYLLRESLGVIVYADQTHQQDFKVRGMNVLRELIADKGKIIDLLNDSLAFAS